MTLELGPDSQGLLVNRSTSTQVLSMHRTRAHTAPYHSCNSHPEPIRPSRPITIHTLCSASAILPPPTHPHCQHTQTHKKLKAQGIAVTGARQHGDQTISYTAGSKSQCTVNKPATKSAAGCCLLAATCLLATLKDKANPSGAPCYYSQHVHNAAIQQRHPAKTSSNTGCRSPSTRAWQPVQWARHFRTTPAFGGLQG